MKTIRNSRNAAMRAPLCALALCAAFNAGADVYTNSQGQQVECDRQTVTTTRQDPGHPILGTLAGGAVGGLVGNQFGKGKGNSAMTAAGAVGGAVAGNRIGQGGTDSQTTVQDTSRETGTPPPYGQ